MRLTCPNCGAQYEVPDQVIPEDGRDVQCSNCGGTWFQAHPDHPQPAGQGAPEDEWDESGISETRALDGDTADVDVEAEPEGQFADPEPHYDDPSEQDAGAAYDDAAYDDDEYDAEPAERELPPSATRDNPLAEVLREEAEREARLRAAEERGGLESQPELGLDEQPVDDARRRAEEARARMARLRGQEAATSAPAPAPEPEIESRRGLLPDIEEINSSLKSTDRAVAPAAAQTEGAAVPRRKSGGFSRGVVLAMLVAVLGLMLYKNAPRIAQSVPQADPALNAFVASVDNARFWLDRQIGALIPRE